MSVKLRNNLVLSVLLCEQGGGTETDGWRSSKGQRSEPGISASQQGAVSVTSTCALLRGTPFSTQLLWTSGQACNLDKLSPPPSPGPDEFR